MSGKILIAYATKHGSTAEIAEAIGKELISQGLDIEVLPVNKVNSITGYQGAIIGAPVYMGRVIGDFTRFANTFKVGLMKIPVAAFVVGMAPVSPDSKQTESVMEALHKSLGQINPVSSVIFAGNLDMQKLFLLQRKMISLTDVPTGDHRDWDAIAAWARETAVYFE